MPHVTAGITAKWGTTSLGDITELKWLNGGGLPQARSGGPWSFDLGTIEVTSLSPTLGDTSQWGKKATLAIGGTARSHTATATVITVSLTTKAICQTLDMGAKVNDVWRYKGTFKIVQE
jgi:hypothetical protein